MPQTKRRSPVLAALASFTMPGLGQLYNGQPRLAALWFFGYWGVGIVYTWQVFDLLLAPNQTAQLSRPLGLLLLMLVLWLSGVVQAIFAALDRHEYTLQSYNRGLVYAGLFLIAYVLIPLVLMFPGARWAMARRGITTPEQRGQWVAMLQGLATGKRPDGTERPVEQPVDLKIEIPDPDAAAAAATTVFHITLVGGPDGGIYDATTAESVCTHGASPPSWAGLYANPGDTAGVTAVQFRVPIEEGETSDFQLSVNRGSGTESRSYVVDGRRPWGEDGKGRATVERRGDGIVIRVEAATAEGVRVEAVVQCRRVGG